MEQVTKFKLKTFLKYLVTEPFTTPLRFRDIFTLPNWGTISWILIGISLYLKNFIFLWISFCIGIIFNGIKEYKSGKYIYWYRNRNKEYLKSKDALKKIRQERNNIPLKEEKDTSKGEIETSGMNDNQTPNPEPRTPNPKIYKGKYI